MKAKVQVQYSCLLRKRMKIFPIAEYLWIMKL